MSTSIAGMHEEKANITVWYKSIIKEVMRYLEEKKTMQNIILWVFIYGSTLWRGSWADYGLHLRKQFIGIASILIHIEN